ncbi:hypothetical protein [Inconstantimicrobium mannanitabidum]|uniref:Uncharacterized protein n=1 Tax=Inconstantimicrobium mannanitabidum TaxID=1604901 RepID=A0ACB5RGK8_9CLOT|nr:hypothetical protein [Clostridium sp. TW13]GKX68222.1 hypothetical protein rsdtw13_34800 [Clostridium sp. TW13]
MEDFKSICITYFIMLGLTFLLKYTNIYKFSWLSFPLISLLVIVLMIILFIKLNVNLKSALIFFAIILLLMMIIAIDSNSLFGKYSNYGLYIPPLVFPFELLAGIIILTLPFQGILILVKQYNLLNYSCIMFPTYIIIIALMAVSAMKLFKRKK